MHLRPEAARISSIPNLSLMANPLYDLIVIGAGSAGYNGAASAARLGLKVALVDGAKELGGLCILRGCMPSKAILAAANRLRVARESAEFGLSASDATLDVPKMIARKDRLIAEFADYRRGQIENGPFTFIHGRAQFLDSHTVEVTAEDGTVSAIDGRAFLLATGSKLNHPKVSGLEEIGYLHSDTALHLKDLPKSLIVLGAGAIGLEFAHYFSCFGIPVTILQRSPQILKGSDEDVANSLQEAMEKRGVKFITGITFTKAEKTATGKAVHFTKDDVEHVVEAEEIFHGMGRVANTDSLRLQAAGIHTEDGQIKMHSTQQTSAPHVFAAGDVCGPYEIVHIAIQQAELAVRNVQRILNSPGTGVETIDYRLKLFVLFTHPEVAQVGLTEKEAKAKHLEDEIAVASYPFNDHGKSLVMGETEGFVKMITRKSSGEILGAAVVGPEAATIIHEIAVAMHFKGTARDVAMTPHYHPTLSEIWTYPAEELAEQMDG